jgi:DNA-binding XRE family transcriptional regulator
VTDRQAPDKARAELGAELAAYRRAARCCQARLAQLIGYSRSSIANVETGRQRVPRDFWERADAVLRTGGTLATGHDELEAAQRNELRAAAHQVSTARQARTWQQSLSPGARDLPEHLAPGRDAPTRHALGSWRPAGQTLSIAAESEALPWPENGSSTTRETGPRQINPGGCGPATRHARPLEGHRQRARRRFRAADGHLLCAMRFFRCSTLTAAVPRPAR